MENIPKSLTTFYNFMKDKGFPMISAVYGEEDGDFACVMFFDESVTLDSLWDFLRLPNLLMKSKDTILSTDDSYMISNIDGIVALSLTEKNHANVMCYIMQRR